MRCLKRVKVEVKVTTLKAGRLKSNYGRIPLTTGHTAWLMTSVFAALMNARSRFVSDTLRMHPSIFYLISECSSQKVAGYLTTNCPRMPARQ